MELLTLLPLVRFLLLRIVMVGGMEACPMAELLRGEEWGEELVGAGSFDLAELMRSWRLDILPRRLRI